MLRFLRIILTDSRLRLALIIAGGLNVVLWILFLLFLPHIPFLFLSYNIHVGINNTGPWWYAFSLPLLGLGVFMVNTALAAWFFLKERLVSYYCVVSSIVVQCILVMAGIALVLINR